MKTRTFLLIALVSIVTSATVSAAEIVVKAGESIQQGVNRAKPGDTVLVMPGTYHETVFVDKDNIHLLGVIDGGEWPTLDGRGELNDGILVAGHGATIEQMYVRHYKGNGIMTQGGNNFRIIRNRVEGRSFYGIFPQFGKNGLVAWNTVWDVEDAAIYAGMCENVDIRANETHHNVIGIETENSRNMLVEGNYVHDNSSGIIQTLIPGLPIKVAEHSIIRNNFIVNNNTPNFAPEGSITSGVPPGTGILIYAADASVVEGNIIRDNQSVGILITDQAFLPAPPDPREDPLPDSHKIMGNIFLANGQQPQGVIGSMLGAIDQKLGPDIMTTGKGRNNCLVNAAAIRTIGTDEWGKCDPAFTTANIRTQQLDKPVASASLTGTQKGRLTYLAVCTGCHSYSTRLLGPPMVVIQALYKGKPGELARWIAAPTKKRKDYGEMPPQAYLPEDVRLAVASYILNDLKP